VAKKRAEVSSAESYLVALRKVVNYNIPDVVACDAI